MSHSKTHQTDLTWFTARQCWKKKVRLTGKDKVYYFRQPNTKAGYEAALAEWFRIKTGLIAKDGNQAIVDKYVALFGPVCDWYTQSGIPVDEAKLSAQVHGFIKWINDPTRLTEELIGLSGTVIQHLTRRSEILAEFHSTIVLESFTLPDKWQDRIARAGSKPIDKEPQTIGYWIERYLVRVADRGGKFITKTSAKDRRYKLNNFMRWCDKNNLMTTITDDQIERYHHYLDSCKLSRDSKVDYFSTFRMFVRWSASNSACEFQLPKSLGSREFTFREPEGLGRKRQAKKLMLWSKEDVALALDKLPQVYQCYVLCMLNCAFRHVDIGSLRWVDLDLENARITIQRNKLNQQDTAPVISYLLWPQTVEAIRQAKSTDPKYVFRNKKGNSVEVAIKTWWKRYAVRFGLTKRLDYLRKTGATVVARYDSQIDDMYLGETLSRTAKIHYSFVDGEPCPELDDAIMILGSEFGFCPAPHKRVSLTPGVIEALEKMGVDIGKI